MNGTVGAAKGPAPPSLGPCGGLPSTARAGCAAPGAGPVRLDARAGGRRSAAPAPGLHDGLPSLPAKKGVARGDAASGRGVVSVRDLSDLSDLSDAASGRGFVFVRDLSGATVVVPCAREDTVAEVCARARSRGKRRARCAGLEAVAAGEGAAAAAAAAALNLAVGPRTSQSAANLGGAMGGGGGGALYSLLATRHVDCLGGSIARRLGKDTVRVPCIAHRLERVLSTRLVLAAVHGASACEGPN